MPADAPALAPESRRPGRPRGGRLLVERSQLLEAAIRAVTRLGPDATMDDVAAEASVTKPVVYRTVGDKAALTVALSEWLIDRIDSATREAQAVLNSPRAQFRSSVHAYLSTIARHRNVFLFVNMGEPATDLFRRLVDRSALGMVERFGPLRTRVGLDAGGARTWSYAVVGALQVAATMWQADEYCTLDVLADDLTTLVWDGLGPTLVR